MQEPRLWDDPDYRRLWLSILISAFAAQVAGIALSLVAAVKLQAGAAQLGLLGAVGALPYFLLLLPSGVWLDRMRKLPVYVTGEAMLALSIACIPLAWYLDILSMAWLYGLGLINAGVSVFSGTAGQIVLSQMVKREHLVEAHAKSKVAQSAAEILGPGLAGILIKVLGMPVTLLLNGAVHLVSLGLIRKLNVTEAPSSSTQPRFWNELGEGIRFVVGNRLLLTLALTVSLWQLFQTAAMVVPVLVAIRELGLDELQYGLCFAGAGLGTVAAGALGHDLSRRLGPGPCLIMGMAVSGAGWLQLAWAPAGAWGMASFVLMLFCFGAGVVLIFSNLLALRQAITPPAMLARMTSTMRWITLFPALPGPLLGGWLGERMGTGFTLAFGGAGALMVALAAWRFTAIPAARHLPEALADDLENGKGKPL